MPTQNLQVNAQINDSTQLTNGIAIPTSLWLCLQEPGQWIGCRFILTDTIPQGTLISVATWSVWVFGDAVSSYARFTAYGEDLQDPGIFTAADNDISNRARTTMSTDKSDDSVPNDWYDIDVTYIMRELLGNWELTATEAVVLTAEATAEEANLVLAVYFSIFSKPARLKIVTIPAPPPPCARYVVVESEGGYLDG